MYKSFTRGISQYAEIIEEIKRLETNFKKDPADRKTNKYRWCGAEYESLFHKDVIQNALEINGLAVLGRSMDFDGVWSGKCPEARSNDHSFDVLADIDNLEDLGQKKLCALFHSVALPHSTIVYVGSSPGDAWLSTLPYFRNLHKIIFIDPRPLAREAPGYVVHHSIAIGSPEDVRKIIVHKEDCVLIWDRGDTPSDLDVRDELILKEISLINAILADEKY
ncbi:unnamed protein product [Chilo suppressalis]|uniref:Uncharacterized protein n=1 Tax=Chilo suppressalis TaxID=168631 RepID=A0ABN8B2I1_CHISP|nr:unnamed protein product [Chilo suppressalis]